MDLSYPHAILAFAPPAQPGQPQPAPWTGLVFMLPILVIMYLVMIRPQQKKQKEHAAMLKTVKPGDKILTTGGIVGVVVTLKDKGGVTIRSADTKLEITRAAIAEITERSGEKSES